MAGLLDFIGNMGATPPSYMEGLLGADQMEKLKGQATTTGLANMVLGYLAAPKNQNLGLGRILGGAAQAGMQGAQGVYTGALDDWQTQQKIEAAQKAKDQEVLQQQAISKLSQTNPEIGNVLRAYPQAAPSVLSEIYKPKVAKETGKPLTSNDVAALKSKGINLDITQGQQYQLKADGTIDLINTNPTGSSGTELDKLVSARQKLITLNPNDPNIKLYDAAIKKQTEFAPQQILNVNNQGESEYQKTFGKGLADQDVAVISTGRAAPDQIAIARRIKDTLKQNPITGAGAGMLQQANNILSTAGLIDPKSGVTTQALVSDLSKVTLQNIKSSGLGAGQGFTDNDLKFLNNAMSGSIEWNAANILRVADLNERAGLKAIDKYNALSKRFKPEQQQMYGLTPIPSQLVIPKPTFR